jgi:hypothetical protein
LVEVAEPPVVVTTTFTAPADLAGVLQVIWVEAATTLVAAVPPKVTVAPERFVPAMVTLWPPASGPLLGVMLLMVGAAMYV